MNTRPKVWSGAEFPHSVCWAIPSKRFSDKVCFGTTDRSRARRRRRPHEFNQHDAFGFIREAGTANWSTMRFDGSGTRNEYAIDLLFDADAAVPKMAPVSMVIDDQEVELAPPQEPSVDQTRAALDIVNPVVDVLLDGLGVDPKALSLVATRRGVQLTVDWTVFGPVRAHQAGLLVAAISEMARVPTDFTKGEHAAKIDMGFYVGSDRNKMWLQDILPVGSLNGKPIRAPGALHHAPGLLVYRSTPIPLERRHDPNWIFAASRTAWEDFERGIWPRPELFEALLPELRVSRNPELWATRLPPAGKLIELNQALSKREVKPAGASRLHRVGEGVRTRPQGTGNDQVIGVEHVRRLVEAVGGKLRGVRDDKIDIDRCLLCGKAGKAVFWKETASYSCFSCTGNRALSFATICERFDRLDLLPKGVKALSKAVTYMDPTAAPAPDYVKADQVIETTSIGEARLAYRTAVRDAQPGEVVVLVGPCGTGKSYNGQAEMAKLTESTGRPYRAFVARRDMQMDWAARDPEAIALYGMDDPDQDEANCENPLAALVRRQGDNPGVVVCPTCSFRKTCEAEAGRYHAQEFGQQEKSLILSHAHLPYANMAKFDCGSGIDFVDEGAFNALKTTVEITKDGLDSYRVVNVRRPFSGSGRTFTFGDPDDPISRFEKRAAVTDTLDDLLWMLSDRLKKGALETDLFGERRHGDAVLVSGYGVGRKLVEYMLTGEWEPSPEAITSALTAPNEYAALLNELALDPVWKRAHEATRRGGSYREPFRGTEPVWVPPGRSDEPETHGMPVADADDRAKQFKEAVSYSRQGKVMPDLAIFRPDAYLVPLVQALWQDLHDYLYSPSSGLNTRVTLRRGGGHDYVFVLTYLRRPALSPDTPLVVANATATRQSMEMLFPERRSRIIQVKVPRSGELIVVADRLYSKRQLSKPEWLTLLTEVVKQTIENNTTGRPIGWIAHSEVFNALNDALLDGERSVPHGPGMSAKTKAKLRDMTLSKGYVSGYHRGVAGSNDFADDEGQFVSKLLSIGPSFLPLDEWAVASAPLFSGRKKGEVDIGPVFDDEPISVPVEFVNEPVDLTIVRTSMSFPGYVTSDGQAVVANNLPMPADPRLAPLAFEDQAGAREQSNGRARLYMEENADSVVYQFGSDPTGEAPDEIITMTEFLDREGIVLSADMLDLLTDHRGGKREGAGRKSNYPLYADLRGSGLDHATIIDQLGPSRSTAFAWRRKYEMAQSENQTH